MKQPAVRDRDDRVGRAGVKADQRPLLAAPGRQCGSAARLRRRGVDTDDFRGKIKEDKGWLASLFSSEQVKLKDRYLLSVKDKKDKTIISIYETTGAKADIRFVNQLLTDLKSYLD